MINQNTDFFAYVDNFAKQSRVNSVCVFDNLEIVPVVTIGIPTYKRALTLREAIDSALKQNFEFCYKILVLDNNPERADETEILMNEYANEPSVCYYKNETNLGMAGNWNRIVSMSNSEWVVFLHDDDLIAPCFLADMLNVAKKYKADVVNSAFLYWYENEQPLPEFHNDKKSYKVIQSSLGANFFYNRAGMPTGILWRRSVYIEEGGVNEAYYPALDWVFNSLLSYKHKFLIYQKGLTIYRYSMNTYLKKETTEAYLPIDYSFRQYIGRLLNYPIWFVNMYSRMQAGLGVSRLGVKSFKMYGKSFRPLGIFSSLIHKIIIKVFNLYYDKRNCIGTI